MIYRKREFKNSDGRDMFREYYTLTLDEFNKLPEFVRANLSEAKFIKDGNGHLFLSVMKVSNSQSFPFGLTFFEIYSLAYAGANRKSYRRKMKKLAMRQDCINF